MKRLRLGAVAAGLAIAFVLSAGAVTTPAAKTPQCLVTNTSYPTGSYTSLQAALDDAGIFWGSTFIVKGICTGTTVISTPSVSSTQPLTIIGQQAKGFAAPTLNGGGEGPVVTILGSDTIVEFTSLTITGGVTTDTSLGGGGIFNERGQLTVTNSTISGNQGSFGGGIANGGTLTLTGSTINGNTGQLGGGILNASGTVTLNRSTVSGNIASMIAGGGAGIATLGGSLELNDSTVSQNTTPGMGGGIVAVTSSEDPVAVTLNGRSKVNGNSARLGGGVFLFATPADLAPVAATLILNDSSRITNNITTTSTEGMYGYGGGVFLLGEAASVTLNDSSYIAGNVATLGGGGIGVVSGKINGATTSNVYRNTPDNILYDLPSPF